MREDKRIINDYEIIQSFYVGKREVVVAENQKAKYKYICGYYESNEIFERIDDCFASNDYLDIMTLFCERAKEQVELCKENELSDLGILSSDMYFRISNDDDLTGKIVVENPDNLRREYRNAENQLFMLRAVTVQSLTLSAQRFTVTAFQIKSIVSFADAILWV